MEKYLTIFWFQISASIYRQQPLFLYLTYVSVTVLHEKKFKSTCNFYICGPKGPKSMASSIFINTKAAKVCIRETKNETCIFKAKKLLFFYV